MMGHAEIAMGAFIIGVMAGSILLDWWDRRNGRKEQ